MSSPIVNQQSISSEQAGIERFLLDLWSTDETLYGAETQRDFEGVSGVLFTAWNEVDQRTAMRFIVLEPLTKAQFDDLSIDLAMHLKAARTQLAAQVRKDTDSDWEARDCAYAYSADHVDVYIPESCTDDLIRFADLTAVYAPQLYLHIVPDRLIAA